MKVFVTMLRLLCGAADGQTLLCRLSVTQRRTDIIRQTTVWFVGSQRCCCELPPLNPPLSPFIPAAAGVRRVSGGQRRWRHTSSAGCEPNWERRQCMKVTCTRKQVAAHRPRQKPNAGTAVLKGEFNILANVQHLTYCYNAYSQRYR